MMWNTWDNITNELETPQLVRHERIVSYLKVKEKHKIVSNIVDGRNEAFPGCS